MTQRTLRELLKSVIFAIGPCFDESETRFIIKRDGECESMRDDEQFAHGDDPFYQLFMCAQQVLAFPQSLWPASVADVKDFGELCCLLGAFEWNRAYAFWKANDWELYKESIEYGEDGRRKYFGIGPPWKPSTKAEVERIEIVWKSPTKGDLERISDLAESILAGHLADSLILVPELPKTLPGLSQPYDGGEFVFCVDEKFKVSPSLQDALKAYLDGEPSIDVGASNPHQIQTRLKKLILRLKDAGFQPPAKRWPRGQRKKTQGERKKTVNVVYFDSTKGK